MRLIFNFQQATFFANPIIIIINLNAELYYLFAFILFQFLFKFQSFHFILFLLSISLITLLLTSIYLVFFTLPLLNLSDILYSIILLKLQFKIFFDN